MADALFTLYVADDSWFSGVAGSFGLLRMFWRVLVGLCITLMYGSVILFMTWVGCATLG